MLFPADHQTQIIKTIGRPVRRLALWPLCYPGRTLRSAGQRGGFWSSCALAPGQMHKWKWRLLLPGASEPRLTELNPSGLQDGLSNCVTQPEQPEHSCRLQLLHSPITAEPYREKTRPLRPRRSWFAPAEARPDDGAGLGGGAGYCPRVRMVYCDGHLFP